MGRGDPRQSDTKEAQMRLQMKIALVTGALLMAFAPAALATGKPEGVPPQHGHEGGPNYQPAEGQGPKEGMPEQAKAYGRYCKGESHKHVKGEKGTPFSQCVHQMQQAANHENMAPGRVCKEESRKHEKGEKGTPFSQCVHRVIQLRREERKQEREEHEHQETSEATTS